jgi:murein DD-endopeptidase MepM/ murein hydrolase activator NlpD
MILSLITASLLAAAAVLTPTIAEAAPPTRSVALARTAPPASPNSTEPGSRAEPPLAKTSTATPSDSAQWRSPVGGLDLLTRFDPPPQPWLPGHRGVDLAASQGLPVTAAGAGTVVFADDLAGRGVISIVHANGLRTTYEPVEPLVAAGDTVTVGQTIGYLQPGHASCTGTACLHLGLKRGPLYLDPMLLFGSGKVRLLPRPGRAERSVEHEPELASTKSATLQSAETRKPNPTRESAPERAEASR